MCDWSTLMSAFPARLLDQGGGSGGPQVPWLVEKNRFGTNFVFDRFRITRLLWSLDTFLSNISDNRLDSHDLKPPADPYDRSTPPPKPELRPIFDEIVVQPPPALRAFKPYRTGLTTIHLRSPMRCDDPTLNDTKNRHQGNPGMVPYDF